MRLFEVIDLNPRKTSRDITDHMGKLSMQGNVERKGKGSFATVYSHASDKRLSTVYKIGNAAALDPKSRAGLRMVKNHKEDAYLSYIEMIDSLSQTNPFFPKVYDLKVYQDPDDNIFYRAEVEELKDVSAIFRNNRELHRQLLDRYFKKNSELQKDYETVTYALMMAADVPYYRKDIQDESLKEAFDLIETRLIPLGFRWDMGANNIMFRLTSVGPQIVFTDPIA